MVSPTGPSEQTVLVVDPSEDTVEVLRVALQRRGIEVIGTAEAAPGVDLAKQTAPDLIVLDSELLDAAENAIQEEFDAQLRGRQTDLVELTNKCSGRESAHVIAKPYHYGPLIRRIEQLLADRLGKSSSAGQ